MWIPIALVFVLKCCEAEMDEEVLMLSDVISSMGRPSSVVATLCWSPGKRIHLHSALASDSQLEVRMLQLTETYHDETKRCYRDGTLFVVDLSCADLNKYFENMKQYFRLPYRWIMIDNGTVRQDSIHPYIDHLDILVDSNIALISKRVNFSYVDFIYKTGLSSTWQIEFFATWNLANRVEKSFDAHTQPTALRRLDLKGYGIPICYVVTESESVYHMDDGIDDHIDTITKVNYATTNHLIDYLNASTKHVFTNTWGYLVNGSWSGMTGYIVRGDVEIGGSPMFFTSERQCIVDYISSPTPSRSKFVFQLPKLSYENNLFLLSFKTTVWYSAAALILLMFLALLTVTYWEGKTCEGDEERAGNPNILKANILDVLLLTVGATFQQGSTVELKGSLGRVVTLLLFLALMFLYTSYAANIVALLQSSSSQIRSLEDLLHSRLKFGVHDTVFNRYYFSAATEPVRKAIYQKKVAPPGAEPQFMSMEDGVKSLQKGLFAFHMEIGVGYKFVGKYFQEGEKCGLKEIQYLQVIDPWIAVRKKTPYKEMFKIGFKRIHEHGLQNRFNLLMYEKRPKCSNRGSNFVSVSMVDCYPAVLALTYGVIIAINILFIEILVHKRQTFIDKIHGKKRESY